MLLAPGFLSEACTVRSADALPMRPQIAARAAAKRFNPRRSPGLQGGVTPGSAVRSTDAVANTDDGRLRVSQDLLYWSSSSSSEFSCSASWRAIQAGPPAVRTSRTEIGLYADRAQHWSAVGLELHLSCQDHEPQQESFGGKPPRSNPYRDPLLWVPMFLCAKRRCGWRSELDS